MNNIEKLREHLFNALERVTDKDNPMDPAQAKLVVDISQTLINSAKVEVDFMKATGDILHSNFVQGALQSSNKEELPPGITSIRRNKLTG